MSSVTRIFKSKRRRPPPPEDSPEMQAARRKQLEQEGRRSGTAGTILTGPQGLTGDPIVGRATLLG